MKVNPSSFPGRQDGVLTIFSAVLVLFLMTVMLIYASRVTVFDQRVSNNEQRYRVAFNLAESAAQATLEMIEAAGPAVTSSSGWRNGTWQNCSATVPYCTADLPDDTFAVPGWYIHDLGAVLGGLGSPIDFDAAIGDVTEGQPNATARVSLAMQFVDPGGIATGPPGSEAEEADARTLFMVYGYGFSDCTDVDDTNTCQGRATVA
jgi:hypothetical protein